MIHKNENFPFPRHFVNQDIPSATLISSAEVSGRKKGDPLRDGRYANRKSTRIPLERLNYPAMLSADKAPQGYKGLGPPEISGKVVDQPHPSGGSDVTAPAGGEACVLFHGNSCCGALFFFFPFFPISVAPLNVQWNI
ncbi:hypothetical protein CEXT_313152 [Caerostris extrusa]|uniref:Uncharacterized protein n=1 Tax=Caerostris extrusa TaxID=172846 RepID=A0AAV4MAF1_CAEEX|nr:hypothetical protein CEXT_313152 [Caerostris extrusa]